MREASASKMDRVDILTDIVRKAAKGEYRDYADLLGNDDGLGDLTHAVKELIDRMQEEASAHEEAHKRLQHAEPLLSTVLPTIQDSFTIIDRSLTITYVNQTAEEHFKACMPLVGRKCYEAFHNRTERCEACLAEQAFMTGVVSYSQSHYSGPAGEWYDVYYFPLKDPDSGKIGGVLSYARDITELKRAEDALKATEERFRNLMDHIPGVAVQGYKTDGTVIYWNKASESVYGYSREEALGKNLEDLIVPEELKPLFRACLALGQQAEKSGEFMPSGELLLLHKDGHRTPVHSIHMAVVLDGEEAVLFCLDVDLSERKRAEEKLRESEERFRHLAELLPEGVYELDSQGKITYANPSALEHFGYASSDLEKRFSAADVVIPSQREIAKANVQKVLMGGEPTLNEYTGLRKDGSTFPIMLHSAPMVRDGKIVGARGICLNMSQQKHLEAQLVQAQKMECVGRLAGGVAHDFNNMLTVILGYTELMKLRLHENDPLWSSVAGIERAALGSKDITTQLLVFSRRQIISPKPLNLNALIRTTEKTLSRLIGEDIDLRVRPGKDIWKINADPSQIDQVLMNLAVNARDAMPHGGKLVIETANALLDKTYCQQHPGSTPGAYVMLRVSDNGAGMDDETLNHIYEPFFTTKEAGKGTGLGLATVYGIVQQNDGFIDVMSAPGQGTTFEMFLPRLIEEGGTEEIAEKAAKSYETGTILLVEDNPMVRNITTEMLETLGHKVVAATTPEEAIKLCKKESLQIDLLLTDVVLPEMSGKELKDRMDAMRPGISTLFMSGYPADVIGQHGVLEPGTHFLQKPFKIEELREKVQEAMKKAPK